MMTDMTMDDFMYIHGQHHHFDAPELSGELMSIESVVEFHCSACGLYFALNLWGANRRVHITEEGDGSCLADTEEEWVVDHQ